jgi:hypothetical protein
MVTVTVPVVALPLAVRVSVLVVVAELGLNEAVTPLGKPEADKLTLLLNPLCGVTVTVLVPLLPCIKVTLPGVADRPKLGTEAAFKVRPTVVVCVRLPDVPVIVTVLVPVAAVLLAVNVSELVVVVDAGVNVAVTPVGKGEADKATLPVKPFMGVTVIVSAPLVPP